MRSFTCKVAILLLLAAGCSSEQNRPPPSLRVAETDAEFAVKAEGELIAAESLPISLPGSIRMWFNIAWLAPEFSEVSKGEVVARFDDIQVQLDREETSLEVARLDYQLANTERTEEIERTRIGHESVRVDGERDISESYEEVDPRLFSRNELIDALSDLEYLDAQAGFLQWQFETFDQRTTAERNTILTQQEGKLTNLQLQDTALGMMELRSPEDGTFVYARTPWGEKLAKGKNVYSGRPIGFLPVKGKVRARLYVPEADAVGLAPGQSVRLRLDSATERVFTARVDSVSPVASPRDRVDPQKFVSVDATIDEVDPELMRVGSRLRGEIVTGHIESGLVVPSQVVYGDGSNAYLFVVDGRKNERREVTVGRRSPDLVEITAGVEAGDRISLAPPADAG